MCKIFVCVLFLSLPNIWFVYQDSPVGISEYLIGWAISAAFFIPLVLLAKSTRSYVVLFLGFSGIWLGSLTVRLLQDSGVTETHIRMLLETNPMIALEFLRISWMYVVLAVAIVICVIVFFVRFNLGSHGVVGRRKSAIVFFLLFGSILGSFGSDFLRQMSRVYPFDVLSSVKGYFESRAFIESHRDASIKTTITGFEKKYDILILVVGESSTAKKWSINDYGRNTNPRLAREHIVFFPDVVSQTVATRLAVPALLSKRPFIDFRGENQEGYESSVADIFRRLGYATYWISNHPSRGFHDETTDIYMQDFDRKFFINPTSLIKNGTYDADALPVIRSAVKNEKSLFLVFHQIGNHFDYSKRFPKKWRTFDGGQELIDAYDDALVYNDYVNGELIDFLKASGRRVLLMYASDHGDDIDAAVCGRPIYSRVTSAAYNPAVFFWSTDLDDRKMLTAMRMRKYLASDMLSLFLGLSGIEGEMASIDSNKARMVQVNSRTVDYDQKKRTTDCFIQ